MSEQSESADFEIHVRNRMIAALELSASLEEQFEYQRNVPFAQVPAEVLWAWDEASNVFVNGNFEGSIYTDAEKAAARMYNSVWQEVCEQYPGLLPPLDMLVKDPHWLRLSSAAQEALNIFKARDRLPEVPH